MPNLTANTIVMNPETGEHVLLAEGGPLPEWAVGLVGDHMLDEKAGKAPTEPKADAEPAEPKADDKATPARRPTSSK